LFKHVGSGFERHWWRRGGGLVGCVVLRGLLNRYGGKGGLNGLRVVKAVDLWVFGDGFGPLQPNVIDVTGLFFNGDNGVCRGCGSLVLYLDLFF
jgi:hypothetical protein